MRIQLVTVQSVYRITRYYNFLLLIRRGFIFTCRRDMFLDFALFLHFYSALMRETVVYRSLLSDQWLSVIVLSKCFTVCFKCPMFICTSTRARNKLIKHVRVSLSCTKRMRTQHKCERVRERETDGVEISEIIFLPKIYLTMLTGL